MNIFVDSNMLYDNPYFDEGANNALLRKMKRVEGKIFLSEIVIMETRNNLKKRLNDTNLIIRKERSKLKRLSTTRSLNEIDVDFEIDLFDKRYKKYIDNKDIAVLKTNNGFMPEIIDRSIKRIKPFTEKKQEFRDCLIWLTYAKKVEEEKLENCFFITNNYSDFCLQKGKNDKKTHNNLLHEDLMRDTSRIKIYNSVNKFIDEEGELLAQLDKASASDYLKKIDDNKFLNIIDGLIDERLFLDYIDKFNRKSISKMAGFHVYEFDFDYLDLDIVEDSQVEVFLHEMKGNFYAKTMFRLCFQLYDKEFERIGHISFNLECRVYFEMGIVENSSLEIKKGGSNYLYDDNVIRKLRIENIVIRAIEAMDIEQENQYYNEEENVEELRYY